MPQRRFLWGSFLLREEIMVDIYVKDLVKSFEVGKNLLDGLSFEIQQGERVGLLGKNGAGKTTVFRTTYRRNRL